MIPKQLRPLVANFTRDQRPREAAAEPRLLGQLILGLPEKHVLGSESVRRAIKPAALREVTDRYFRFTQRLNGLGGDLNIAHKVKLADFVDTDFLKQCLLFPDLEDAAAFANAETLRVGKSGGVLQVREKEALLQEVRIHEICQLNLMGNIQVTTQAIQTLCEAEIPVSYFSQGGWFYGTTNGLGTKNVFLRQAQYKLAEEAWFCRRLAGSLIAGKIRNQRTQLLRNHEEPPAVVLSEMKDMADAADKGPALESLLGIEGYAARLYFGALQGLVKVESQGDAALFQFDFQGRNRRPPRDPINALLSLAYSMLTKDMTIACTAVGFDPMMGFYHRPRHGRPALALDLMEPFRPLIADSAVMQAINTKMVQAQDFVSAAGAVALRPEGRKAFYRAYELRMDSLVTHPLFDYRVSYRRLLEIQARLLGKMLQGEIGSYPVFVTR